MSTDTRCSPSQPLFEGSVRVKYGQNEWRVRHLKAFCGISEGEPAKLIVYKDKVPSIDEKSVIQEILFTNVRHINSTKGRDRRIVTIEMVSRDRDQFSFYAESLNSLSDTTVWFKYCGFLRTIPCYSIPDVPQKSLVSQQDINQYTNPKKFDAVLIWVVYILTEGIVEHNKTLAGLRVITIRSGDDTFNMYDFHTKQHLLTWERAAIRRSGCMKSLVFLEAGRRCSGGPGLLWMQHPIPEAMTLRQCLQDFLYYGVESLNQPRAKNLISCDAAMSKSYLDDDEITKSFSVSHEDQHTDLPSLQFSNKKRQLSSFEYNFHSVPVTQHVGCKPSSQASADSQYSSGYFSENSSLSDSRNDTFLSPNNNKFYPKGKCKLFRSNDKKHRGSSSSGTEDDKCTLKPSTNSHAQTYQNCFAQSPGANNYENASTLNSSGTPPLPPKPAKRKNPIYENRTTLFPTAPSSSSRHHRRQHDGSAHNCCSCEPTQERHGRSHSDSEAINNLHPTLSKNQMELSAFQKCSPIIVEKLNIPAILPHLLANEMLTQRDTQIMQSQAILDVDKATHLICMLPRQGDGFFEKFILCLCGSKPGTGHSDIVKSLTAALKEAKGTFSGPVRSASLCTAS